MPIVDIMASSNTHFQKLRDFITCSLPAGFPVKIEIPLFHVINARITFGNIFALANSVQGVSVLTEDDGETLKKKIRCFPNFALIIFPPVFFFFIKIKM